MKDEHGETWGVWNRALVGLPNAPENFLITQFIKDVFLDSQVNVGLLSNVPAGVVDPPGAKTPRNIKEAQAGEILTSAQTAAARDFVNGVSGSQRMLAHALLYVGKGNLDYIRQQAEELKPDSWKGYNIGTSAKVDTDPNSLMKQWRHDDEAVAYPTFELIQSLYEKNKASKPGQNNICVHKGLIDSKERRPEIGHPADLPKAARDWPKLNFITYHACIQPAFFLGDSLAEVRGGKLREGVPDISWTTEYAVLCRDLPNTYAEIGTTWASAIVTFPTVAAHLMGQLLKFFGPGSHRVRLGLGVVRLAAVADRGAVALPDSGGDAPQVRVSGAHAADQAQDPRPEFREALRHEDRPGPLAAVQAGATRLPGEDVAGVQEADGSGRGRQAGGGQPRSHARALCAGGRDAGPSSVRVDPHRLKRLLPTVGAGAVRLNGGRFHWPVRVRSR